MLLVVLDASALMADFELRSPYAQALLAEGEADNLALIVPEIALIETEAGYRRQLRQAIENLRTSEKRVRGFGIGAAVGWIDIDQAAADYMGRLKTRLDAAGAEVAGLPSVPHAELVERAVNRRAPFDEKGGGYRDALLWYTVLDLPDPSDVALITNDNIFYDVADRSALASDLASDLVSVRVYRSVQDCVTDLIEPAREWEAEIQDKLDSDHGFSERVQSQVREALEGYQLDPSTMPDWTARTVRLRVQDVLAISKPQVAGVLEAQKGEVVVAFGVECEILVEAMAPPDELDRIRDNPDVSIDYPSGVSYGSVRAVMRVAVDLAGTYDTAESDFADVDTLAVQYVGTRQNAGRGKEPPAGARVRLMGGELGTVLGHLAGYDHSVEVELDNGSIARMLVDPVPLYVDPTHCSEPDCEAWAMIEATRTAWALDHPRRAARRMDLGHTPFCPAHVPSVGDVWAVIRPIGEDELPLPGLSE
jgi:hypothetical protein